MTIALALLVLALGPQTPMPLTIECRPVTPAQVSCTVTNTGARRIVAWRVLIGGQAAYSTDMYGWLAHKALQRPLPTSNDRGLLEPGQSRGEERACPARSLSPCATARVLAVVFEDATGIGDRSALEVIYEARSRHAAIVSFWLAHLRQVAAASDPVAAARQALAEASRAPDAGRADSREFMGHLERIVSGRLDARALQGPNGLVAFYEAVHAEATRHETLGRRNQ